MSDRHELVIRHRRDVVHAAYRLVLGRDPDDAGLAHWHAFMVADGLVSDLLESLRLSDEARQLSGRLRLLESRDESTPPDAGTPDADSVKAFAGFASLNSRAQEFALRIAGAATRAGDLPK